jgi:hypothetical protein
MILGVNLNLIMAVCVAVVSLAVAAGLCVRRKARFSISIDRPGLEMPIAEQVAVAVLIVVVGYLLITSLQIGTYWPVRAWDALTEYDFRGRIFAQTGTLDILHTDVYYASSPIATSLAHAWSYIVADGLFPLARPQIQTEYLINGTTSPVIIYWFFYLCLLLALYRGLRRARLTRIFSLLVSAVVASTPLVFESSTVTLIEAPFSYYLSLGMVYLYLWLRDCQTGDIVISGLMFGLSAWTRPGTEIFAAGAVLVLALAAWRKRRFKALGIFLLFYVSINLVWRAYVSYGVQQVGLYDTLLSLQINFVKIREIYDDVLQALTTGPAVLVSWLFFVVVFLANLPFVRQRKVDSVPLLLSAWCILAVFAAMYVVTIRLSVDIARYLSHLWPFALYACAVSPLARLLLTDEDAAPSEGRHALLEWASQRTRLPIQAFYLKQRSPYIIGAIVLVSFSLIFSVRSLGGYLGLVSPGTVVSITAPVKQPALSTAECVFSLSEGWHSREQGGQSWWRWSPGQAKVSIISKQNLATTLNGELYSIQQPNTVDVLLNGDKVATWEIPAETPTGFHPFSSLTLQLVPGDNQLEFISHNPAITPSGDNRPLAIALKDLVLTPSDSNTPCVLRP